MAPASLPWTQDEQANRLLAEDPLALIVGMLLDQQFPMERAFYSPFLLAQRMGGTLDIHAIAEYDPDAFAGVFQGPPALHRFPGSMAKRTQALAQAIVEEYDGDVAAIWRTAGDADEFFRRLRKLPGFGDAKARIFVGVVGKRLGEGPPGWESVAADWPSIADVDAWERVAELRAEKRRMKEQARKG